MISIFVVANFVKGEEFGDHCCFIHSRKRKAKNLRLHYEGNDMLSSDKLRYFDFTTHKMRLGMFLSLPIYSNFKGKSTAYFFFSLREVLDWFLALESEINDPEYHEHDCMMAYFHM